jgi:hypothetical protein
LLGAGAFVAFLLAVVGIVLYITFLNFPTAPRAQQLQALSAEQVQASSPGATVLVEGRISGDNSAQYRDFVAYRLERAGERASYVPYDWVRPPLLLELHDGLVRIVDDYKILHPTVQQSYAPQEADDYTYRIRGFEAGNPAVAIGTTQAGAAGGIEVKSTFLYGGTRAEFIARQQRAILVVEWLAPGLIGGGLLLFCLFFALSLAVRLFTLVFDVAGKLWRWLYR